MRWRGRASARATNVAMAAALLLGLLVAVAPVAAGAEPNVPRCPSRMTSQPLFQGDVPPTDCVGSRLLEFDPPTIPAIAFDEVLRFTWPEMCTNEQTQTSPSKCIWRWKVQLIFFEERPDGSLQQLYPQSFRFEFATDDPGCDDIRNYCEFIVRPDATVPDDVVVVAGVYATSVFCNPPGGFAGCDAEDRPWITVAQNVGEIVEPPGGLDVSLTALSPSGDHPLDGVISVAETTTVRLTLTNEGDRPLTDFTFAGGSPLVVDARSTGGLEIVSGPAPPVDPALALAPGEAKTFTYEVEATAEGVAAAHSKVTAFDPDLVQHSEAHSLRFDIADGIRMTREVGEYLRL
ncbi:MAG TPA: hypothetical protein VEV43_05580, partial [Actinomycetota bacterium]|nr:hypothetical protein [Actinomycetota bacterium]